MKTDKLKTDNSRILYDFNPVNKKHWIKELFLKTNKITKKQKLKKVETVIREREKVELEQLRKEVERLRNFKRNILSGVVFNFNIDDKLLEILLTYKTSEL